MQRASLDERRQNNWKVFSDINKNSLRITSYENGDTERSSTSVDMLPLDIEIFQNLVDNICRKFNPGKGENLLCFGGCAVFSDEGVLQRVENFLPQSPALLSSWLKVSPWLHAALVPTSSESRTVSEGDVRKALWEALLEDKDYADALEEVRMDRASPGRTDSEVVFQVNIPEKRRRSGEEEIEVEDPTAKPEYSIGKPEYSTTKSDEEARPRGRKKCKYKLKNGLPLPPRPVLSLSQEEVQHWFPALVERLGGKRFPTSMPRKFEAWDADVDAVLTAKDFMDYGPRVSLDWTAVSSTFCWKLKLAAAIILDKRGFDYTTFAEDVEEKHEKYSINDLKLMSMSKNPETFEKLFVKNGFKGKKKPNYLDEFERKSSEIVLQNLRLINARDKRINGNSLPRQTNKRLLQPPKELVPKEPTLKDPPPPPPLYHQRIPSQAEVAKAIGSGSPPCVRPPPLTPSQKPLSSSSSSPSDNTNHSIPPLVDTMEKMVKLEADALEHSEDFLVDAARANPRLHQMPALKPIDEDFVFNSTAEDLSQKQKRKKSMESKEAKPLSQKYMCKNNFQKGDFLIHPLHLHAPHGPVKLVTFRRETKKVFLSVSEFETASVSSHGVYEEVVLERDSHKPRSTPAKFLDSFIRINDSVEVLDRRPDKMRIKRKIPKNDVISEPVIEHSNLSSDGMKLEINYADDDTEDSKESLEDDSEMVIDET